MAKKIIKALMQQRHDTRENWAANNPVLLEGEIGLVTDDPNLYKVGDGRTAWNDLKFRGFDGTIVQDLGDSTTSVMSQAAVSENFAELAEGLSALSKNYQFAGLATPDMNPGSPASRVFYFANLPGTYTNFGGLVIDAGEMAFLKWNGEWSKISLFKVAGDNILISEPYFPVNEHTESSLTIAPNIYHKWGVVSSLTLSLAPPTDDTITNEYVIEFTAGATAPTIALPDNLLFAGALEIEANATYQISIINGLVVWSAFKDE